MKRIRKLLTAVLSAAMVTALVPAAAMAAPTANPGPHLSCSAGSDTVRVGDEFTVTIKSTEMSIASLTGGLVYDDTKVELKELRVADEPALTPADTAASKLALTISQNAEQHSIGIAGVGTEDTAYQANEELATAVFTAKAAGDAAFTLYEDVDGTDAFQSDSYEGITVSIGEEEAVTYIQADGTETKLTSSLIRSCDPTENGNYKLSDVLAAAGITTKAECRYAYIGGGDYTVYYDADYYDDMALYYNGGWRCTYDTNAPGFQGGWYKVGGLHTIKEENHAYGEDHACANLITKGRNQDKSMQEEACGDAEAYVSYVQADGTETLLYTSLIESCDLTENGNYMLSDVLTAAGITTKAECRYTFIGSGDYTVYYDADYYDDMALYYNGGWRCTFDTNAPGFQGGWYKVGGLYTIKEENHAYGEDHLCANLITKGRNQDKSMQEEACGQQDPSSVQPAKDEWIASGSKWWYRHADGSYTTNGWEQINGVWYLFDKSGWMLTGWQKYNGTWYYLKSSGAMATGWVKDGSTWYYMQSSGAMATGWVKDGSTWYYMQPSGAMATGWVKVGNTWYYMQSSGAMATGWVKVGNTWYYMSASGAMLTGWQQIGGSYYYMYASGAMAQNTWIGNYYVNGSGVWTQTR